MTDLLHTHLTLGLVAGCGACAQVVAAFAVADDPSEKPVAAAYVVNGPELAAGQSAEQPRIREGVAALPG